MTDDMPLIHSLEHQLDITPPRLGEVEKIGYRVGAASIPGPNGVPYKI